MSFLFGKRAELRDISSVPWSWGGDKPIAATSYNVALASVPVYAATGLIADMIASSPWAAFRKTAGVPERLPVQPNLVVDPGVNGLDLFSWKHQMCSSLLLWGNAYGYNATFDNRLVPEKIQWLRPDKMTVDESGSQPRYFYNGAEIDRDLLTHIPWYTVPGSVVSPSPIALFRSQIETGLEAQRATKNFFRRGGVPSAHLKNTAKTMKAEEATETKKRFVASVSSSEPFVSGNDWEYTAITLPNSDASFLSGIKATATQIAAVYRVAPEDVGGETSSSSLTYKSLEQDQIRFNVRTLRPVATRFESVFNRYFINGDYVRFNLDSGVRADLKTRYEAHEIGVRAKFKTRDEVRALEELGPLTAEDIDQFKELDSKTPAIGATS